MAKRVDDPSNLCVSFLVRQAWLTLRAAMDATLSEHGLSMSQFATLLVLDEAPGSSVAELARVVASTRQSANELLAGMAEHGLVERRPHPTDRRTQQLYLTDEGRRRLAAAAPAVAAREAELEAAMEPARQQAARAWLRHVSSSTPG